MNEMLKVSKEQAQNAWRVGNADQKEMLEHLFGDVLEISIIERVKSYEDACKVLGIDPVNFDYLPDSEKRHISALIKLETITKALNEGWEHPQKLDEDYVYWPWFIILSDDDDMEEYESNGYTVFRVKGLKNAAGLAYSYSIDAPTRTSANLGPRLGFKTRELAIYAAKTFTALYADYILL